MQTGVERNLWRGISRRGFDAETIFLDGVNQRCCCRAFIRGGGVLADFLQFRFNLLVQAVFLYCVKNIIGELVLRLLGVLSK